MYTKLLFAPIVVERPSEQADDSEAFYELACKGAEMSKRVAAGKARNSLSLRIILLKQSPKLDSSYRVTNTVETLKTENESIWYTKTIIFTSFQYSTQAWPL